MSDTYMTVGALRKLLRGLPPGAPVFETRYSDLARMQVDTVERVDALRMSGGEWYRRRFKAEDFNGFTTGILFNGN